MSTPDLNTVRDPLRVLEVVGAADKSTLAARSPAVAHCVSLMLSPLYALEARGEDGGEWNMNACRYGGEEEWLEAEEWFEGRHGVSRGTFLVDNANEVAECLESVLPCGPQERADFYDAKEASESADRLSGVAGNARRYAASIRRAIRGKGMVEKTSRRARAVAADAEVTP